MRGVLSCPILACLVLAGLGPWFIRAAGTAATYGGGGGGGGAATMPWRQSYKAGYLDRNARFAGGSEIMHIKSHKGRLFAFNGFWEDAHYPSQSAQVLRLDTADGQWVVDLDTGAGSNPPHMKGNIMHSVTFSTDARGKPVNATLLVAASQQNSSPQTNGTALSVFQRDDATGAWDLQTLLPGPKYEGRKVPRDMQVYHDDVVGVDRIFLLAGQPGVLSGVYESSTGRIKWDTKLEFPTNGSSFAARPLGLQIANKRLYFAVGGYIYVRTNGAAPSWELAYTIPGKVNIEVGGIRGLTTMANPTGPGDSLIFVWVRAQNPPSSASASSSVSSSSTSSFPSTHTHKHTRARVRREQERCAHDSGLFTLHRCTLPPHGHYAVRAHRYQKATRPARLSA